MTRKGRSIDDVLASLESLAGFHREREAFYAAAAAHLEKQRAHAAELAEISRRLSERGLIHLVRRGRPHWKALYVQEERT